jgi:hypothetical protein
VYIWQQIQIFTLQVVILRKSCNFHSHKIRQFFLELISYQLLFIVVLIKIETKIEYNKIKSTRNYFELSLTV